MTLQQIAILLASAFLATAVLAQTAPDPAQTTPEDSRIAALLMRFSADPDRFTQTDGEALYRTTCQACHMEDAKGATGAGAHPPLAGNPKLTSRHFIAGVILTGYHGMPRFGPQMTDEQVAAVTNFVRGNLGNAYPDPITAEEVAELRPPEDRD